MGRFTQLSAQRDKLQSEIQTGHELASELLQRVQKSTAALIGFIQEEKEEFERASDNLEQLNSSQYVSRATLVPAKRKVQRSQVA